MTTIEKIKAEVERLKSQLVRGACAAQIEMETNCKEEAYDEVLSFLSTLESEKPVPNDLKEAAREYAFNNAEDGGEFLPRHLGFIAGAKWQKEQMIQEAVEVYPCFDKRRRLTGFSIDPEADGTNGWSCRIILCKIK